MDALDYLIKRCDDLKQPRVLLIQDISASCRISMNVAAPVVSCLDNWVSILPTALLSTHTGQPFTEYTFLDLTDEMGSILKHWKSLDILFDGILIGYLGSRSQIELVRGIIQTFAKKDAQIVLDPAMGDQGVLYSGFTQEYVEEMAALCKEASVIVPNVTEACFLTNQPCLTKPYRKADIEAMMDQLRDLNKANVILTGVTFDTTSIGAACISEDQPGIDYFFAPAFPGHFDGAGDLFTSVVGGFLFQNQHVAVATEAAVSYNNKVIERTIRNRVDPIFGLQFETDLPYLIEQLQKSKATECV